MTDRRRVKQLLKIWISIGALAIVVGYGSFKAKDLAQGPHLAVSFPVDGQSFHDPLISIKGKATNISFLTLNGNKIFTDEAGVFSEKTLLLNGYNKVTVEAQDRFGRKVTRILQLILK